MKWRERRRAKRVRKDLHGWVGQAGSLQQNLLLPVLQELANGKPQLPTSIRNPEEAEQWLQALSAWWEPTRPDVAQKFVEAQNRNREQYAQWFMEHGGGGL